MVLATRAQAVTFRTRTISALHALVASPPDALRERLRRLPLGQLLHTCAGLRDSSRRNVEESTTGMAMRSTARRALACEREAAELEVQGDHRVGAEFGEPRVSFCRAQAYSRSQRFPSRGRRRNAWGRDSPTPRGRLFLGAPTCRSDRQCALSLSKGNKCRTSLVRVSAQDCGRGVVVRPPRSAHHRRDGRRTTAGTRSPP